jgi:hypothetical protein
VAVEVKGADLSRDRRRAARSVPSGLSVTELRDGVSRAAEIAGGRAPPRRSGAPPPPSSRCWPRTTDEPFRRDGWIFELKYDGARVVALKGEAGVKLVARSGRDVTNVYPESRAVRHLPVSACAVDGEVVALDERGAHRSNGCSFRGEPEPRAETEVPSSSTPSTCSPPRATTCAHCRS